MVVSSVGTPSWRRRRWATGPSCSIPIRRHPPVPLANEHLVAAYDDPVGVASVGVRLRRRDHRVRESARCGTRRVGRHGRGVPVAGIGPDRPGPDRREGVPRRQRLPGRRVRRAAGCRRAGVDPSLVEGGAIVKTARLGYDGKGQRFVVGVAQTLAAWAELGGVDAVVERRLDLDSRAQRDRRPHRGSAASRPGRSPRTVTSTGSSISRWCRRRCRARLADRAVGLAMAIADALDYVGVLAVELFVVTASCSSTNSRRDPHNSGHWTLDACVTSQFEQQVRAVCGLGLGSTAMTAPSIAMVNLLGDLWANGDAGLDRRARRSVTPSCTSTASRTPRPGRKMGHLTVTSDVGVGRGGPRPRAPRRRHPLTAQFVVCGSFPVVRVIRNLPQTGRASGSVGVGGFDVEGLDATVGVTGEPTGGRVRGSGRRFPTASHRTGCGGSPRRPAGSRPGCS